MNNPFTHRKYLWGIFTFFALFSCRERVWDNPFDPECPKEIFSPSYFLATQEGKNIKLVWTQSNRQITGFEIRRSIDGASPALVVAPLKDVTSWTDTSPFPGKQYEYSLVALAGNNKSNELVSSITLPALPSTVTTESQVKVYAAWAIINGNVTSDGGSTVQSRGICWHTSSNPTVSNSKSMEGTGTGGFSSTITGLSANTTYYARAYSTTAIGTSYGNEIIFKTFFGEVTDIDGNVYPTVKLGKQEWMAENLAYLPLVSPSIQGSKTDPYYYVYGYQGSDVAVAKQHSNYKTYGVLYNWAAAMAGAASSGSNPSNVKGICPAGWHLPSDAEWTELENYIGGRLAAGGKLKELGTTHWNAPNSGATNETLFTALPGGCRLSNGGFYYTGSYGGWWNSTESNVSDAWNRGMSYDFVYVYRGDYYPKDMGLSIRCVKD